MRKTVIGTRTRWAVLLCAAALAGCGGSSNGNDQDAVADAGAAGHGGKSGAGGGAGARADAGPDARPGDASSDSGADARNASDSRADGQTNPDTGVDAVSDAPSAPDGRAFDGSPDAAADLASVDGATDLAPPTPDGGNDAPPPPPESYVAALSGAEEVPPVATAATGLATITYDPGTRSLTWTVTHNLTGATAGGIYTAGAGEVGTVAVAALAAASPSMGAATLSTLQEADLRVGHLYVDLQSSPAPGAQIRGQILRPGETLWVAKLNGAEEIPANASPGTAAFSLIVNSAHTNGHYRVTTSLTPTVGHIHTAIAGVPGDPIVLFNFVGSAAEADIALDAGVFAALDQARLYANVHTADALNGQIRGQILRPGERLFVAQLSGANEIPPLAPSATTGTGAVQFVLDAGSTSLRYQSLVTGLIDATAALVFDAPAGSAGPQIATLTLLGLNPAGTWALGSPDVVALTASRYYVDIRSTAHPAGEIRGQITPR